VRIVRLADGEVPLPVSQIIRGFLQMQGYGIVNLGFHPQAQQVMIEPVPVLDPKEFS